jgi:hypothetical protein
LSANSLATHSGTNAPPNPPVPPILHSSRGLIPPTVQVLVTSPRGGWPRPSPTSRRAVRYAQGFSAFAARLTNSCRSLAARSSAFFGCVPLSWMRYTRPRS